ncbi:MAG: TonB-dependent receptor plug domain-containing protein, partial [Bacteroidaceae bacterium]|nr:TonB-dependent receptor plug domain-containing protein [Bacteroidaceae bacterium]
MMKKNVLIGLALSALVSSGAKAENGNGIGTGEVNESETAALDTVVSRRFMTDEVVIENDPKTLGSLRHQALSYSEIGGANLRNVQINSLKTASQFVPNLFIPDYGSRLTSAIYIRGIGSRVNTPAVGLYGDDVAFKEKSAFDISFNDVSRIEVLRGPQSTLYGSNTMGGLIQVYSHSPLEVFQFGPQTVINLGGSTKDVGRYVNFRTMHPMGNSAAYSVSGFYQGRDGYNTNTFLNRSSNGGNEGGGKFRLVYNPASDRRFLLDFKTSLEYSDENGYDYYNVKDHQIVENELGSYRRTLMNTSLKLKYDFAH